MLVALLSLLSGCARPPPAPPPLDVTPVTPVEDVTPTLLADAEIVVVGDIMMHGSVKRAARRSAEGDAFNGYGALFAQVKPALSQADLAFGNLEFPVAPDHHRSEGSMVFNAPPDVLNALADAGFDVVSFANNHVFDQGIPGFVETVERLEASPLDYLGAGLDCERAKAARIYDLNGIKVGFIAATRLYNGYFPPDHRQCSFHLTSPEEVFASAEAAREAGAEIVLLSVHWGQEYKTAPHKNEVELAHALLDGGIDAIIGHHPHVLQPLEVYETQDGRRTFVIYSLGNFISGQGYGYRHGLHHPNIGNTRDGGMLRFKVVRKGYGRDLSRVELADVRFDPLWVIRRREHPQTLPVVDRVQIQEITRQIGEAEDAAAAVALQRELEIYADRRLHAGRVVGSQWLLPLDGEVFADPGE
ncbi:MAG: CapA family protein [Myxococcota bacterium]